MVFELSKVEDAGLNEMLDVDLDLDKYVEHFASGLCDGDKTRMAIMDHEITLHKIRCNIIHTTRTIGHISHDHNANFQIIDL